MSLLGILFFSCAPLEAADPGTLTGTVTDSTTGLPISGTLIQVKSGATVVASTTTNTSGKYTLTVTQGTYDIVASKTGYGTVTALAFRIQSGQTRTKNFALQRLGSIAGTVTDVRTGLPLQNVTVQAIQGSTVIGSATTASNGTYSIGALVPGSYTVTAAVTNYTTTSQAVTVAETLTTTVNFALLPNPGTIAGNVKDLNTLLNLSGVAITVTQGGSTIATATTDTNGNYSISGIYPGTNYSLQASITNYNTQTQSPVTVASNTTTFVNLSLVPQQGTLSGTVTDLITSGTLSGVTIDVIQSNVVVKTTTTGTDGAYTVAALTPGTYTVRATLLHYQTNSSSATILSNQLTTVPCALNPNPGAISGTVTDIMTTDPISGATVEALQGVSVIATTTTASDGKYTMSGLIPGSYTVQASILHYQTASVSSVAVISDTTATQSLSLQPNSGTLSGTVTDSLSGSTLAGVTISISKGGVPVTTTTTGANGTYSVTALPPGTNYSVQADLLHYGTQNIDPVTINSDHNTSQNFPLVQNSGTITGTVRDSESGTGITGVTIVALQGSTVIETTTSIESGGYTFSSSFIPGDYTVQASRLHYQNASATTTVTPDTPSTVDLNLVANTGSIAGTITDSLTNDPMGGVSIVISQGGSSFSSTTTAANGTYTASALPPGSYDVQASKTAYNSQTTLAVTVTSDTTQTVNFGLVPKPGSITGTVSDSLGTISGATVDALQGGVVVATATTGGAGTYTLSTLNPGSYTVRASEADHGTISNDSVTVAADTATTGVDFLLPINPATITGHVYDTTPAALQDVTVDALQGNTVVASANTDIAGAYTLPGLPPGAYSVRALKASYETATQNTTVVASEIKTIDFTLEASPGIITGTVTDTLTLAAIANATVKISKSGTFIATTTTAGDGTYTVSNLAPGAGVYAVALTATHYSPASQSGVTVTALGTTTVPIAMAPNNGVIAGTVTDSAPPHTAIAGANVRALQGAVEKGTATTALDGSYTISPTLPPGSYDVEVSATNYQTATPSTLVVSDQTITVDVSLVADPGTISGLITTTLSSAPIEGAIVEALRGGTVVGSTTANGLGAYSLTGLAPGSYDVQASATNYQTATQTGISVLSNQTAPANISLVPQPGTISGTITDSSSSPLEGATVDVLQGGIIMATDTTAADGTYSISDLLPGSYTVRASLDTYQTAVVGATVQSNQTTTVDLILQDSPRTISGTVVDTSTPTPLPISGATIDILQETVVLATATTLEDGTYSISSLAPGIYTVRATATGYQTATVGADVLSVISTIADFSLEFSPHTILGTVTDATTSNSINGALIEVLQGPNQIGATFTDVTGAYSIAGFAPGSYSVRATSTNYQTISSTAIIVVTQPTTNVDFALESSPGTVSGQVTDAVGGTPIASAAVNILQGSFVISSSLTDTNGFYTFQSLKPGNYYVVLANAPAFQGSSQTASVLPNQTTIINIALTPLPGTITGHVTDGTSQPLAGATVSVLKNNDVIGFAITGTDGTYTLPGLAPDNYVVRVFATNYQASSQGAVVVADTTTVVDFTLQPSPGSLAGSVLEATPPFLPLTTATINVIQNNLVVATAGTDVNGTYSVQGIAPGSYTVRASCPLFQTQSIGAIIVSDVITSVDFSLAADPGGIAGQITDQETGSPLANVSVTVFLGSTLTASTQTDINGNYSVDTLAPGTYTVRTSLTNYQTASLGATVVSAATTTVSLQLLPSPGTVAGTVLASGSPAAGAAIELSQGTSVIASTVTSTDGTYVLSGIAPGNYTVRATLPNYQISSAGASVTANTITTLDFTLYSAQGALAGHVQNQLLTPISGTTIDILQGANIVASTTTDPQGNFLVSNLAAQTYTVIASAPNYQASQQTATVVLPPEPTTTVNFTLSINPGSITGSVLSSSSSPIAGATIAVTYSSGGAPIAQAATATDGSYTIANLAPGAYTVSATSLFSQTSTQGATVTAGVTTSVNFTLQPSPGTLVGTVTDTTSPTPLPLSGATIDVVQGSTIVASALTANDGSYIISGISPANYSIRTSQPSYQTATKSTSISANETSTADFALLSAPGSISGQVDDDSPIPSPIPGASVDLFQNTIFIGTTTTDAQALYSFSNLAPNTYIVRASAFNYQAQLFGALVLANHNTSINFSLQQLPATISGTVTDTTLPIPQLLSGATVEAIVGSSVIASAVTDAFGGYTLSGLFPGNYSVRVTLASYSSQSQSITVAAGATITLNFALASTQGTLIGSITDSTTGNPIASGSITIFQGSTFIATTQTNSSGYYTINNVLPGQYTVRASALNYQTTTLLGTVVASQNTTVNFSLLSNPARLQGVVTDDNSMPIGSAAVRVQQSNTIIASTTTATDGTYDITGFAPGSYIVVASAPAYRTRMLGFTASSGQAVTDNFVLQSNPETLVGRVTDAITSAPLQGVTVDAILGVITVASATTQEDGTYSITGLSPTIYSVRATLDQYRTAAQGAIILEGLPTTSDFALVNNPGSVDGTISDVNTGNPIPGATINFIQGATLMGTSLTDDNGHYLISTLAPGQYMVQAIEPGYGTKGVGTTVTEGGLVTVSFSLSTLTGTVAGTVVDNATGTPVGGAIICVLQNSQISSPVLTAADGTYSMSDLLPGGYTIRVRAGGFQTSYAGAFISSSEITDINFYLLSDSGNVTGTVTDHLGGPIPGATIQVLQGTTSMASVLTDTSGVYFVPSLPPGYYSISVTASGYVSRIVGILVPSYPPNVVSDFILTDGSLLPSIQGTVIDIASGAPLPGALIEVLSEGTVIAKVLADINGSYTIFDLADGSYTIRASSLGYQTGAQGVIVNATTTATSAFALVFDAGSLGGTITDATTSLPVTNAAIQIFFNGSLINSSPTNSNGQYFFTDLNTGTYTVNIIASGYQTTNQGAIVFNNQTTTLNVPLSPGGGSISGLVTDSLSHTIAGAAVVLTQANSIIQRAVTDTVGHYLIEGAPAGHYEVLVSRSTFQSQIKASTIVEGETTTLNFSLSSNPGTIIGTVRDALTSTPIASASLDVFQGADVIGSTISGSDGTYSLSGLPMGSYLVRAGQTGYQTKLAPATIASVIPVTVDYYLPSNPGNVIGTVTSAATGAPIPGALVVLQQKSLEIIQVFTDEQGRYSLTGLAPGSSAIVVSSLGYQSGIQGASIVSNQTLTDNFQLQVNPATVSGVVRNAITSNPIIDAEVFLMRGSVVFASTITDPLGYYSIPGIATGTYTVRASAPGYQTSFENTTLTVGQSTAINFSLGQETGAINGFVQNSVPVPLAGVTIRALQNNIVIATTITGADGLYTLSGLAPGDYVIRATQGEYCVDLQPATIVTSGTTIVDFTLSSHPGTISGFITDAFTGAVLPSVRTLALQSDNVLVTFFTDSNGFYTLVNLAPGQYTVVANGPDIYQISTSVVDVLADQTTTHDISLERNPGAISGNVQDATSHAMLQNVEIAVLSDSTVIASTTTNASGEYSIPSLPPGTYTVRATGSNIYQVGMQSAVVESLQTTTVDFSLLHFPGTLTGRVKNATTKKRIGMANVVVYSSGSVIASTFTNANGIYTIEGLPPGRYKVVASKGNRYKVSKKHATIVENQQAKLSFSLTPIPAPPRDLSGKVKKRHHNEYHKYKYKIEWKESKSHGVKGYYVYRDGKRIAKISKKEELEFIDYHRHRKDHTYCVRTIDTFEELSVRVCVSLE